MCNEDGVGEAHAVELEEVHAAEASEAGTAEITKVGKLPFFLLLSLLGFKFMSSPNFICTVDLWPSAPTFSAKASYLLWVVTEAGVGATGSFLDAIANEERERLCCVRLYTPPVGHCEPPLGQADHGRRARRRERSTTNQMRREQK